MKAPPAGPNPLLDRTVVVTGAARGIGAAVARNLAGRGARLALLGHEPDELRALAAGLPVPALAHEVDVTDQAAMERAAALVRERLGPPSAVVANAGVAEGAPFADSDLAAWRRIIDVNLGGSAVTARTFLPDLFDTRGYYLQVASLASFGAAPMMSAYCASKSGVEAFAHSLRAEVAHRGVAVGIGYLNWTDTEMIRDGDRYPVLRELRGHMPPPARRVHPAELVAARLASAVEHRSTAVYIPRWLRLVQVTRAALPPLVLRVSRRALTRLEPEESLRPTGALGAGGQADRAAARRSG
ncbi:SDR family oxidoreductase [Streptomyces thermospinosisporus]|uniref:SDR family oxidoreductase n=1 Tax=Streptomyces thermospinosisporus TaxID=161482 RepID=A0ABN1YSH7_9ACTN